MATAASLLTDTQLAEREPVLFLRLRVPQVRAAFDHLTRETERIRVLATVLARARDPQVAVVADLIHEIAEAVDARAEALALAVASARRRASTRGAA